MNPLQNEPTSPPGLPPLSEVPSMNPPLPTEPNLGTNNTMLSQDQMKANLQDLMSKIQVKKDQLDTSMFDINKTVKESNSVLFGEVYDFFTKNGIDPTDPEAVKAFLDKIKATQPDVYQMIESIINQLMEGSSQNDPTNPLGNSTGAPTTDTTGAANLGSEDGITSLGGADLGQSNNMNINTNDQPQQNI